jgi:hypothetical protein
VDATQACTARYAGWSGLGAGLLQYYQRLTSTPDPPNHPHHHRPHSVQGRLSTESCESKQATQKDGLARGKLWLVGWVLSNGSRGARSSPGNQRRSVCLPSSVLARCPGADSACGGSWPRLQIETFGLSLGRSRVWLHGQAACLCLGAWVQLRHCMFNWTLALTQTEMHRVGICRSSKDHIQGLPCLLFLSFFSLLQRQHNVFQVLHEKEKNTRTLIRAFATCHIPCSRRSVNHAALWSARTKGGLLPGAARGETPISIIPRLDPIMDGPSLSIHGPGSPEPRVRPKRAQMGSGAAMSCQTSRQIRELHSNNSTAPHHETAFLDGFNLVS